MTKKPLFLISTEGKSAEEMDREIEAAFDALMKQLTGNRTEPGADKPKPKPKPKRRKTKPINSEE